MQNQRRTSLIMPSGVLKLFSESQERLGQWLDGVHNLGSHMRTASNAQPIVAPKRNYPRGMAGQSRIHCTAATASGIMPVTLIKVTTLLCSIARPSVITLYQLTKLIHAHDG